MNYMVFTILLTYASYLLILGGIIAISWLLERIVKIVPVIGEPASWLLKAMSFFRFFVGIILIMTAAAGWFMAQLDSGTQLLLLSAGLALFLKPIKDLPWAALFGLAVGGLCAGFLFFYYPPSSTFYGIPSIWIYLLVFFVPALFVYMIFKFVEDVLKLVGMIITLKPITLVIGFLCIIQGIFMLLNTNIFTVFLS
ncbi:MAG: hypothetical protein JSV20_03020 [Candidatus Bathyarchaeota archaeon]|nr:MAG: hypothetical protein JSV20_03020 [Candidatus Bathyarchaeota archaeon]